MAAERVLIAARDADLDTLKYLKLSSPTNLQMRDSAGANALNYAARNGHLAIVKWLIQECNFDVCARNLNGSTLVHDVSGSGQLSCLKYLARLQKLRLDCPDQSGITALHLAARFGHVQIVKFLVEEGGCSPFCKSCTGISPVHCAAVSGNVHCLAALLGQPIISRNVNLQAYNGTTPLFHAAQDGQLSCVQFLVQNGAETSLGTDTGLLPIHAAAQNGHLQCLMWLVEYARISATVSDQFGATPAHYAAAQGHIDILRWLNDKNAITQTDSLGGTPLHDAAEHGQLQSLQYLLESGVDLLAKDRDGLSALDLADRSAHRKCSDFLKIATSKAQLKSKAKVADETSLTESSTDVNKIPKNSSVKEKFTNRPFTLALNNTKKQPPPVKPKSSSAFVEMKAHNKGTKPEYTPLSNKIRTSKEMLVSPSSGHRPLSTVSTDSILSSSRPISLISTDSTLTYVTDDTSISSYEDLIIPPPPTDLYPQSASVESIHLPTHLQYPQVLSPPPTVPKLDLSDYYYSDSMSVLTVVEPPPVEDTLAHQNDSVNFNSHDPSFTQNPPNSFHSNIGYDSGIASHSSASSRTSHKYNTDLGMHHNIPLVPAPISSSFVLPSDGTIRDKVRKQQNNIQSVFPLSLEHDDVIAPNNDDEHIHNQADILSILNDLDNKLFDESADEAFSQIFQTANQAESANFQSHDPGYGQPHHSKGQEFHETSLSQSDHFYATSGLPVIDHDPPDQVLLPPPLEFDVNAPPLEFGVNAEEIFHVEDELDREQETAHQIIIPTGYLSPRALPSNLMAEIKAMHQSPVPLRSVTDIGSPEQECRPSVSPVDVPTWRRKIVQKKFLKKQEDEALEQLKHAEEEAKWAGVPEWKKKIIQKREDVKIKEMQNKQEEKMKEEKKWDGLSEWQKKALQRQEKQHKIEQTQKERTKKSQVKTAQKLPAWKQAIMQRDNCVS